MDSITTRNLLVDASALELEQMLESLTDVGDVLVSKVFEADFVVYEVGFLTNHASAPVLGLNLDKIAGYRKVIRGSSLLSCDASSFE